MKNIFSLYYQLDTRCYICATSKPIFLCTNKSSVEMHSRNLRTFWDASTTETPEDQKIVLFFVPGIFFANFLSNLPTNV